MFRKMPPFSTRSCLFSPCFFVAWKQMLKKAVRHCPRAEMLWLMAAKEKWLSQDVDGARTLLQEAFLANPDSEQV